MSTAIEVVNADPEKERKPQDVMVLQVPGQPAYFLEHGSVIFAKVTEQRAIGAMQFVSVDIHLRSGAVITLSPLLPEEAQTALNHAFGLKTKETPVAEDKDPDGYGEAAS